MKTYSLRFGLLILLACKSSLVFAVWYQVEMIIFENLYPNPDGEIWYRSPDLVPLDNTVTLLPLSKPVVPDNDQDQKTEAEQVAYEVLPEENNRLGDVNRILRLSREYRPLYHLSWQQPGLDQNRARPIHLQDTQDQKLFELTMPPLLVTDPMPTDFYEPINLVFDGSIQVRSSLYLHVDLDMVLFRAPPVEDVVLAEIDDLKIDSLKNDSKEPVEYVRLTETRRVILNELHYFDHPLFGVILQVSRFGP